jgi:hypothetical protein
MIDCNWLQSLEVGIDPAHTSFMHRFFGDEDPNKGYGKMFRDTSKDSDMPMTQIMREFPRPRIEVEPTTMASSWYAAPDQAERRMCASPI